ncbi:MAG: peptide chain release factor N(5)-glutamine methyltransferase [Parcubacteria group bacterium]|nr:peptide chain release factor N(5)-glutamine methyltransferase [Parcubacteria group bacterium]
MSATVRFMTIMEALQWANNKLKKAGVDSPMLDAEILLAHTLGESKAWLFSHFSDKLKIHHREQFHELIDRRTAREPVAYITGKKAFYGRDFQVNAMVLIPRPETETMVEVSLKILEGHDPERTLVCDIGTGSGALAVTLAAETSLSVIAIDVDKQALSVASQNATQLGVSDNIDFQHGSLAEPLIRIFKTIRGQTKVKTSSVYPFKHLLITANLPYLPDSRLESTQPEVHAYEPHLALVAGRDGLDAYFDLFRQLRTNRTILPRRVTVLIEIDPEQRRGAESLIEHAFPTAKMNVHKDLQGLDRVIEVEV